MLPGHEAETGGQVQECGCNRERTLEANSSVYADAEDSWQPQHLQGFKENTVPLGRRRLLGAGTENLIMIIRGGGADLGVYDTPLFIIILERALPTYKKFAIRRCAVLRGQQPHTSRVS